MPGTPGLMRVPRHAAGWHAPAHNPTCKCACRGSASMQQAAIALLLHVDGCIVAARRQLHGSLRQSTGRCAAAIAGPTGLLDGNDESSAPQNVRRVRVRAARAADADAVAQLCGQVFAEDERVLQLPPGRFKDALAAVQRANAAQIAGTILTQMQATLNAKQQATREAREWRLYRRYTALEAEIAALRGGRNGAVMAPPTSTERRQLERWQRQRQFVVLLAEDAATGQLLGTATLSLTRCEAALPPPFPTSKQLRLYVSNMVTAPEARRQGIAMQLLHACMRLGRRWRSDSAWLHVEEGNTAGLGLYQAAGFRGASMQPLWKSGFQRNRLMTRTLPEPPWQQPGRGGGGADEQRAAASTGGTTRESDGVFIWKAEVHR